MVKRIQGYYCFDGILKGWIVKTAKKNYRSGGSDPGGLSGLRHMQPSLSGKSSEPEALHGSGSGRIHATDN